MFTLIKREIQDHIVYFIGAVALSAILIAMLVSAVYYSEASSQPVFVGLSIPVFVVLIIGCTAMGVSQMYTDRNRKVSTFLSALPVTRDRILAARIITGLLAIVIIILPLTITGKILWRLFAPPIPIYPGVIFDISTVSFLMLFACYCIGLQTGWTSGKVTPTLGGIVLACIFVPLILIKGFGLQIVVILVLFIIASLIRIWHTFMTTSL